MKTRQTVESRESRVERKPNVVWRPFRSRPSSFVSRRAFTLVELLVVIAIIAIIAAFLLPLAGAVKRKAYIQTAQSEMAQIETAIGQYKSTYGFYPPSNGNPANSVSNQLYFELVGTTNIAARGATPVYRTLDGSAQIDSSDIKKAFGVTGFMNCSKPGGGESAPQAEDFLPGLKPTQVATLFTDKVYTVNVLVASAGGPDPSYQPIRGLEANPWRYNASRPTYNHGSYDLYVQLSMGGTTNLICNWSKQVQVNSLLP